MKKGNLFIWRLLITMIILFAVVILDYSEKVSYEKIKETLSKDINILQFLDKINGESDYFNIYNLEGIDEVAVDSEFEIKEPITNGYRYFKDELEGVVCKASGVVVRVSYDGTYKVVILDSNDNNWVYENLTTFDFTIYSYINSNEIIGKCNGYYDLTVE